MNINDLFSQINTLVQTNQILSTVAGGSLIVWLVSNIKSIFSGILNCITALISFRIVNTYEETRNSTSGFFTRSQRFFNQFLSSTRILWERTQNLDLANSNTLMVDRKNNSLTPESRTNIDSLTYGFSIRIMFGKIVFCHRTIDKGQKITVNTELRVFFASKKKFIDRLTRTIEEQLVNEVLSQAKRDYVSIFNGECADGRKSKRAMDSIFTNNNEHYRLLQAIRDFRSNKDKYLALSYPYNFSALLYGEPGCGKSSTILAIASALNCNIEYVNLSKISLEKLINRLNSAGDDILVFEDIDALSDAVNTNRAKNNSEHTEDIDASKLNFSSSLLGISLSDLLNITDGLLASDGTICLFTTNHIERLDPAFLRSGRMNALVEFSKLNRQTAARMLKSNLGYDINPASFKQDAINPADLQSTILNISLGRETFDDLARKFLSASPI